MSTDPRVEIAGQALYREQYRFLDAEDRADLEEQITTILAAADAADREAGIHRVKVDDATVERVALALMNSQRERYGLQPRKGIFSEAATADARAVLTELTRSES